MRPNIYRDSQKSWGCSNPAGVMALLVGIAFETFQFKKIITTQIRNKPHGWLTIN